MKFRIEILVLILTAGKTIMSRLGKLLRAVFVLPFSAGNPKQQRGDETFSHDGSLSGLVFLVTAVIILSVILLIGSTGHRFDRVHSNMFIVTMTVTACLATFICVALTVYAAVKRSAVLPNAQWDISEKIMMRFLWLFTLASVSYSALYLAYHFNCFKENYEIANIKQRIICDSLLLVFRVVQTGFLTRFSKCVFASSLGLYYSLLILFLTNISVIVIEFAHNIRYFHDFTVNITINQTFAWPCETNSSIVNILDKMEEYLEPAVVEYSLLTILFITQIWPTKTQVAPTTDHDSCVYDRLSEQDTSSPHMYQNLNELINSSHIYENLNEHTSSSAQQNNERPKLRNYFTISAGILLSLPGIILYAIKVHKNVASISNADAYCNSIEVSVMVLVTIQCFYLLQSECKPKNILSQFGSKEYLILASFIGSLTYYTMRIIPYISLLHTNEANAINIYNYVVRIVGIYLQTIFIFQMKSYERNGTRTSFLSVEYSCLFLSTANLMVWGSNSFQASLYVFSNDAPSLFYGKHTWMNSYILVYPFVIFYRFKCFVAFYGLYHRMKT